MRSICNPVAERPIYLSTVKKSKELWKITNISMNVSAMSTTIMSIIMSTITATSTTTIITTTRRRATAD